MLMGEYSHSLDTKGRLIMPAKLRQDIGDKFILTKGLDGCLFAFSQTEWNNFEEKLKGLPLSDKNARNFVRFFFIYTPPDSYKKRRCFFLFRIDYIIRVKLLQ